jgi:cytochrome bd ubiquinol oxidase subunit II
MTLDLPLAWALVIGFALTMYVILDGFDLGVGMLLLTMDNESDRDIMVRSIAPVWDGNETWLVLVGAGLLGGFPSAYGIALPAFYLPLIVMLLSLALRGTAFEFRFQTRLRRWIWDAAFSAGSWGAALCQGLIVGALLTGVRVRDSSFAGSALDCLRPFGLLTALTVASAYMVLGATWLMIRTTGTLADASRARARAAGLGVILAVLAVVGSAPRLAPQVMAKAAIWNPVSVTLFVAGVVGICTLLQHSLGRASDRIPFAWAMILVLLVEVAFVSTVWPFIIPYELDFWHAASAERSQMMLLAGAVAILPFVLAYSAYSYFVFRGKVAPEPEEVPADTTLPESV